MFTVWFSLWLIDWFTSLARCPAASTTCRSRPRSGHTSGSRQTRRGREWSESSSTPCQLSLWGRRKGQPIRPCFVENGPRLSQSNARLHPRTFCDFSLTAANRWASTKSLAATSNGFFPLGFWLGVPDCGLAMLGTQSIGREMDRSVPIARRQSMSYGLCCAVAFHDWPFAEKMLCEMAKKMIDKKYFPILFDCCFNGFTWFNLFSNKANFCTIQ